MRVKLTNAGGFEQHRPAVQSGGQKSPSGAFLDARLATSTRAHQKSFNVTITFELFVLCARETHECGWIRTASARRMVRRAKKPLRGFFRCAARDIHPRPPKNLNVSRCIPLFLFHLSLKAALPCGVTKKDALRSLAKRLCL